MSFGPGFIGYLWSTAVQDELPFAAVQRALPNVAFPDMFAGVLGLLVITSRHAAGIMHHDGEYLALAAHLPLKLLCGPSADAGQPCSDCLENHGSWQIMPQASGMCLPLHGLPADACKPCWTRHARCLHRGCRCRVMTPAVCCRFCRPVHHLGLWGPGRAAAPPGWSSVDALC